MAEDRDGSVVDMLIIGGGVNGCGIARDAAGRGLSVCLVEMDDLASGTSSASTKLLHGGLRYLEFFKFRLVREALKEREVLLTAMPHIARPMRFVLPMHPKMRFDGDTPVGRFLARSMPWLKGRRPAWVIRLALLLYDSLGGRKILPATRALDFTRDITGAALKPIMLRGYEYSDVWVDDARLVVLNAQAAHRLGAEVLTRSKVEDAQCNDGLWTVLMRDRISGARFTRQARSLVNAAGPWAAEVIQSVVHCQAQDKIRLVRGSHIIVPKLYDHDRAYFLQGSDGRIIFAIPYEAAFTMIGTTDLVHEDLSQPPKCSDEEQAYLIEFASRYFNTPLSPQDVVARFSGVRPLYDDGAKSATAATREYVLTLDMDQGAPLLNVFGGKITTYRKLAEAALAKLAFVFPALATDWTAGQALPGGDFAVNGAAELSQGLRRDYPFLSQAWARRLIRAYGTNAATILAGATGVADLGQGFAATLTEAELRWMITQEFARSGEDVLWRRSKLGLHMSAAEIEAVNIWMTAETGLAEATK